MRDWLREARIKKNKTMAQMADALDISESYYSYIEAGERQKKMDVTLVVKLAKIFSVTPQQIVKWEMLQEPRE